MVKVLLHFSEKIADRPITSEVIIEQGTAINILSARVDQQGGEMLIDIPEKNSKKVIEAFHKRGVTPEVRNLIEVDKDACLECGGCISLCPAKVITFKEDASVVFNEAKCLGSTCGLCVNACPVRAIKLVA